MSRTAFLRPILLAALLSCGQFVSAEAGLLPLPGGARSSGNDLGGSADVMQPADTAPSSVAAPAAAELGAAGSPAAGAALPTFVSFAAPVVLEIELRNGAPGATRLCACAGAGPFRARLSVIRHATQLYASAMQRLRRGGVDADHLGTPPPQS